MMNKIKQVILDSYRIGCKDLRDLARDKMRIISFIIMPIFMMIMMGYVFPARDVLRDIPLGLVNEDQSELGNELIEKLLQIKLEEGNEPFVLHPVDSVEEVRRQIQNQKINGAIFIPQGFSKKLQNGEQATVTIITDQSNPQLSTTLSGMLEQIMDFFSTQLGTIKVARLLPESDNPQALVKPFVVKTEGIIPGEPNYFQFMAPGVMTMVVMMAVMMGLAGSISRERELGTLDGILVAPISRLSIILGKTFFQTVRGLLQGAIVLTLAILLFGVVIHGSIPLMIFLLILGIFSFVGLGVLISAFATDQETAMTIMMTLQLPMMFLSGAFFPIQQMPSWLQSISHIIPLTYAIQALRKVVTLGAGLPSVTTEIIILASFGVVMLIIAIPIFRRATTT